jgi:hypothetical protein
MAISNNSTGIRTGVCTSTTRPSAPYEGQHIYETDTDIEYVWNGSAWVVNYVSANSPAFTGTPTAPTAADGTNSTQIATMASNPWNVAWGYIANQTITSAQTSITTEVDLTGLTVTFTAQANRVYMVVAVLNAYGVDEEWANIYLNINGTNVRAFRSAFSRTNGFNTEMYQHQFTVAAGSCTAKLRMARENAGTAAVNHYADGNFQASISVIDLGPV